MQQTFNDYQAFELLANKKPLLVCGASFDLFGIDFPCEYVRFNGFKPNPLYEDAETGVKLLQETGGNFIIAVGGGSAIDTAKCIKHISNADVPIMAIPTTSGSGSEATRSAVIYRGGEKQTITDDRLLPDYVVLQPGLLKTLSLYQRKCTMLDALCQAVESWWSKKATRESIEYSKKAVKLILDNMDGYLNYEDESSRNMLTASNLAGKAINITTTTAVHAMSYKISQLYNVPHGHAVALCFPKVWRSMGGFDDIARAFGKQTHTNAISFFEELLSRLDIRQPEGASVVDLEVLTNSVNEERLGNNPASMDKEAIRALYKEILGL